MAWVFAPSLLPDVWIVDRLGGAWQTDAVSVLVVSLVLVVAGTAGRGADSSSTSMKMHSPGQATVASMACCSSFAGTVDETTTAARVVADRIRRRVLDVGDAVLQQDEHVRTVIGAEPIPSAQILIDPHVEHLRTSQGTPRSRRRSFHREGRSVHQ